MKNNNSLLSNLPMEVIVGFYFLTYIPNILLTRALTTIDLASLGRPLTGLETLPAALTVNMIMTLIFIYFSGWIKFANQKKILGLTIPWPNKYTFLSGIGTSLVLFTVPLSFTFQGVSIPFIQLVMRGDILIIAPFVDLLFGRRVRWWSWAALVIVFFALLIAIKDRGNLYLPPLAIATVILYTIGYFLRLWVMTKISKNGDEASVKKYFVEEKIVALPLSIITLGLLGLSGIGSQASELVVGFVKIWGDKVIYIIILSSFLLTIISVLAAWILLSPKENSYCVPLERASSLLAGVVATIILAVFFGQKFPSNAELMAAGMLIGTIILLSMAPNLEKKQNS